MCKKDSTHLRVTLRIYHNIIIETGWSPFHAAHAHVVESTCICTSPPKYPPSLANRSICSLHIILHCQRQEEISFLLDNRWSQGLEPEIRHMGMWRWMGSHFRPSRSVMGFRFWPFSLRSRPRQIYIVLLIYIRLF